MAKNPQFDYFTISLPKTLNQELRGLIDRRDMKVQRAVQRAIEKWVSEMKAAEQLPYQDDNKAA
ncbi:MAG: hypothetical protein ACM31O_21020 [Bacteroidota bacterium]